VASHGRMKKPMKIISTIISTRAASVSSPIQWWNGGHHSAPDEIRMLRINCSGDYLYGLIQ